VRRPTRPDGCPAVATTIPSVVGDRSITLRMNSTAPEITPVS
jgi:hypothetical protein